MIYVLVPFTWLLKPKFPLKWLTRRAGIAIVLTKLSNTSNYLVSGSRKWLMVCSLQEWQLWWPYIFMETVWLNLKYSINPNFMWITWILCKLSEQKCVINFSLLLLFRAEIFVYKEKLDALSTWTYREEMKWINFMFHNILILIQFRKCKGKGNTLKYIQSQLNLWE